jgi:beta-lactamase class A
MDRRDFVKLTGLTMAASYVADTIALGQSVSTGGGRELLSGFLALPGKKGVQIDVDARDGLRREQHDADAALFCGSCFKTFVLAAYLQEVEAARLDELEQLIVDDGVRSFSSLVLENLTGKTPAKCALEAMIAHSDNTATDMALKRVTPARVRQFIGDAGLKKVRIPDSTRQFFSYVAGAPQGTDIGWKAMQAIIADDKPDTSKYRAALNEFVAYYKRALTGGYFQKPETLTEFKRIQAMADAIAMVVPADTPAYMKGGSIDWNGFHCLAIAGQMIVRDTPVTVAFLHNWTDADGDQKQTTAAFKDAVADVLSKVHKRVLEVRA